MLNSRPPAGIFSADKAKAKEETRKLTPEEDYEREIILEGARVLIKELNKLEEEEFNSRPWHLRKAY